MIQRQDRNECFICHSKDLQLIRVEKNSISNDSRLQLHLQIDSELLECPKCHLGVVHNIPADSSFYAALYDDHGRDVSIDFDFSGKSLIFQQVLEVLAKFQTKGHSRKSLLDYGTGTGAFLKAASNEYAVVGIELGPAARNFAGFKGLDVKASLTDLPHSLWGSVEVVTLIDVLEHMPDPNSTVEELKQLLRKDGLLFVKVPNYRAQILKQNILNQLGLSKAGVMVDYVHINHFSPKALREFMKARNLEVLAEGFCPPEIWDLNWKKAPKSYHYRIIYNLVVRGVSSSLNFLSQLTGLPLGLNIYCLAKKR